MSLEAIQTTSPIADGIERGYAMSLGTEFDFNGQTFSLPSGITAETGMHIQFSDGKVYRVDSLRESLPPKPYQLTLVEDYTGDVVTATEVVPEADSQADQRFQDQ